VSANVKTKITRSLISSAEENMNFQIKLFNFPDAGNHVIVIARGLLDTNGCNQIFHKIAEMTQLLLDCKVMIDLQDATCTLEPADIQRVVNGFTPDLWPHSVRVAMVCGPEVSQLTALSAGLSNQGFKVAVFNDSKTAVTWLAETK
jgi:hypothetical protein